MTQGPPPQDPNAPPPQGYPPPQYQQPPPGYPPQQYQQAPPGYPPPPGYPQQYGVAPYAPPGYPAAGPAGKVRSIGTSILLAIVTLGIYCIFWVYLTHKEIKAASGQGVGGPVGVIIYLVFGIATPFLIGSEVNALYTSRGLTSPVRGMTGLWILLPIVGAFVWFIKVQGALNNIWQGTVQRTA
jgi:hypothetical protein